MPKSFSEYVFRKFVQRNRFSENPRQPIMQQPLFFSDKRSQQTENGHFKNVQNRIEGGIVFEGFLQYGHFPNKNSRNKNINKPSHDFPIRRTLQHETRHSRCFLD